MHSQVTHSTYSQVGLSLSLSHFTSVSFTHSLYTVRHTYTHTHFCPLPLTASSDHVARLWLVDRSDPVREYQGHNKAVTALAYNDKR